MGSSRLEVIWSPYHTNKFITWGDDIYLYEARSNKEPVKQNDIVISENTVARLLATNSNYRYVKCIDVYPKSDTDLLLALGQANGKVSLTTFGPSVFDSFRLAGLELCPRHARQCNTVKWNPIETNLLASGYEKHRSDHSILIWDVMKGPSDTRMYGSYSSVYGVQSTEFVKPIMEIGLSDMAHSIAWFNQSPHKLVVGINNKNLKIIDLREITSAVYSQPTKAVYGVEVAPYDDNYIVSFGDNQIAVWDSRNLEKSILLLTQSKIVSKVSWCPTRRSLIGSLQKESSAIHLHDIQQSMEENEPSVLWRSIQPGQNVPLTSFSWHPKNENRLIAISLVGAITDYTVFERMTLNWSPSTHIVWTYGRRHLKLISDQDRIYANIHDLTPKIKRRAIAEYGLKELWMNTELCESECLATVWQWLSSSKTLVEEGIIKCNPSIKHPGIRTVLGIDSGKANVLKSEHVWTQWHDIGVPIVVYKSPARENALQLCGWTFSKDLSTLERMELDGAYARAAAIAIFNLRLRYAIDILNRGAVRQPQLAVIAMALSGYTTDKKSLWRELCPTTKEQLSDPYLKAAFAFLVDQSKTFEHVLCETDMLIDDRVAFACIFLSDADLVEYVCKLTDYIYETGDITGIILTGTSEECIPLLQKYLDKTGDVQSVSLIAVRGFHSNFLHEDNICQSWIESYRSLLDGWRLWIERAKFDIVLNAQKVPPQQVFISCNFCGKSISAFLQDKIRNKSKMIGIQNNDASNYQGLRMLHDEITSCPNCHKPLPRCAICLTNMGTQSTYLGPGSNAPTTSIKSCEFSSWFTWCQTCRHGGHADHLSEWFKEHTECPVSGCVCKCLSLDDI
ncbi:GATOR2 complex protein MIOS-B [Planococcus citri]|uniref:GATOR2 complex protein MIOS-B n=1 Tax=Planococcus citri TaxID=170843 RepID=UPI0031FA1745